MGNDHIETYGALFDIVAGNAKENNIELNFSREIFLNDIGREPAILKGIKGEAVYLITCMVQHRFIQSLIRKMPAPILNLGRKMIG